VFFVEFDENKLDKQSKTPLYFQLKKLIRSAIWSKDLVPGEILPSEEKLSELLHISKATVRQCMTELSNECYIEKRRNRGTIVLDKKMNFGFYSESIGGFHTKVREMGMEPQTKLLYLSMEEASKEIAIQLAVDENTRVIHMTRLRFVNDEPVLWINSYLPYDLAYFIMGCNFEEESLYELLAQHEETRIHNVLRKVTASSTSPEIAELLEAKHSDAFLVVETTAYSISGRHIESSLSISPGGRNEYIFQIKAVN
jgi:GntR family transcriptional regulator